MARSPGATGTRSSSLKTPDMDYLTVWYTYAENESGVPDYAVLKGLTIIGHRVSESWTT